MCYISLKYGNYGDSSTGYLNSWVFDRSYSETIAMQIDRSYSKSSYSKPIADLGISSFDDTGVTFQSSVVEDMNRSPRFMFVIVY